MCWICLIINEENTEFNMAYFSSPGIVTSGLIFCYDQNNIRSYSGPPLTNILPNGINAGYPTVSSGWGTYNTNQYGSGTYFSIGTITGVSNNIVTCPGHPLRTYDVMTPQTSGGGLANGTNYLVRRWDANQFSLYAYDSTQDALNPFQHQVNLNTDNRVPISSGVSNMWWGPPHLPNSGIIKQIIPNGFQYKGRSHDCMRIHWYRPDGVTDGLAYGNEPSIVAGNTYTISFYHKAATPNCVGTRASINRWTNGEYTGISFTVGKTWQKFSYTFSTSQSGATYFYWFNDNMPSQSAWDLSEIMIYQGSGSSEYVPSNFTRSSTQVVTDLTGNYTLTANNLTYNTDGTFNFNGASWLDLNSNNIITGNQAFTVESWYTTTGATADEIFGNYGTSSTSGTLWVSGRYGIYINGAVYFPGAPIGAGTYHLAATRDSSGNVILYRNGVQQNSGVLSASIPVTYNFRIGADVNGGAEPFTGKIHSVSVYNRALSSLEVQQNFASQRMRFGI